MTSRTWRIAPALTFAVLTAAYAPGAAREERPVRPGAQHSEHEIVERGLVLVRLDPKRGAPPGECDDLAVSDLAISVDRQRAMVKAVERVPRPLRHWLLLDVSESAEERRTEAKRSAAQYVREVMASGLDVASVVTVDEDPILVAGPSGDPEHLAREIEAVEPGGWSALRDGLDQVLRQVEGDRHEHLILFWTDGEDQSSVIKSDELLATLARAPNATVFPIALLPAGSKFPPPPLNGATFTEVARRSGGDVFVSSDPRWLDRVRGWIGRRFTIAFTPPEPPAFASAGRRRLDVAVRGKRCQVTVLTDPFARPDPVAGAAPPAPSTWLLLHNTSRKADDTACRTTPGTAAWNWPLRSVSGGLEGCVLDLVRSPGPYVRGGDGTGSFAHQSARFAAREVHVLAPDLARVPTNAAEAVEAALLRDGAEPGAPSRSFMEGNALLAQRAVIATSLFANRADYRDFALSRLQRMADAEQHAIERELAHSFPDLTAEQIAAVARASRAGRRVVEAAKTPTDADLARVLAAWVRDVPASQLLRELEARLVDVRLGSAGGEALVARWARVRERVLMPSRTRIAAPLALVRDPSEDSVGFVRIVLPRPARFRLPDSGSPVGSTSIDARLPIRPFALELVDAVAAEPGVAKALRARRYHATSIACAPTESLVKRAPMKPYTRAHVTVTLDTSAVPGGIASRAVLEADVSVGEDGLVTIMNFASHVNGDRALGSALAELPW